MARARILLADDHTMMAEAETNDSERRMGGNLARQALAKHIRVVGYERDKIDVDLQNDGLVPGALIR